jgi:hypothetical protein
MHAFYSLFFRQKGVFVIGSTSSAFSVVLRVLYWCPAISSDSVHVHHGLPINSLLIMVASSYQENKSLISNTQTLNNYGKVEEQKEASPPQSRARRHFLSFRASGLLILILLSVVLFYHALIITQVIPYEYVWGGKLTTLEQMHRFETISVAANLLILAVATSRLVLQDNKCLSVFCWIFSVLYALNTVGNLFAQTKFERSVFTPVTLLLSVSFVRLATGK